MDVDKGCIDLNLVCKYSPNNNYAAAIYCNGAIQWVDIATGATVPSANINCANVNAQPPFQDGIIVFNFPNGPVADPQVMASFDAARQFHNAGFLGPPILFNGDQKIHIDLSINNNPPFDGVPGGVIGFASQTAVRPDNSVYSGAMQFELASMQAGGPAVQYTTALHEMSHILGVGQSPMWFANRVNYPGPLAGFTGPNALAEYQAMLGGFPAAVAIPVEWNTGNAGSDGSHWDEGPDGQAPGNVPNGYNQDCLSNELMSWFQSGSNTFSRVTAASFRDFGLNYDVNHGTAFPCGGA